MKIINTGTLNPRNVLSPDHTSWVYNGLDCLLTQEIYETILPDLSEVTTRVYERSKALQGPVLDMNMAGILVDQQALMEARIAIAPTPTGDSDSAMDRLQQQLNLILREGYGRDINWRSPKQLGIFLYDFLRLPIQYKRNANGQRVPTTDAKALEKLRENFTAAPVINHLLALRDLGKKLGFLETPLDADGRLRTSYNIAGTNTGRFSSALSDFGTGTNAQNVDTRLKSIFIASPGKKLANLDLEQADSRNVGASCWNRFLHSHGASWAGKYLDACESGDLHTTVTRMARPNLPWPSDPSLWRPLAEEARPEFRGKSYRDTSKAWGHGSNYLLTPQSAVQKVPGVNIQAAIDFRDAYFGAFPCIPEWHKAVREDLRTSSCLLTIMGRLRYFYGRWSDAEVHRQAVAFEGQSPTADEMNDGTIQLWRGASRFPGFQLLNQTHDSVLFEFDEGCEAEIIPWAIQALRVTTILAGDRPFTVPTEAKVGWNWGNFNDDPKRGPLNRDGLKKWKGHDPREREIPARTSFSLR